MSESRPVRDLLEFFIGGGWGSDEPAQGLESMSVVRGADFPNVLLGDVGDLPLRYEVPSKIATRALREGDIVLEISGGTKDRPTGRVIYISHDIVRRTTATLVPASFCRLLRPNPSKVHPRYLYYWLQGMYKQGRTWGYQVQSTGLANFQFEMFLDHELVLLPDIEMQVKIADAMGALDDLIQNNHRLVSQMEALLSALFAEYAFDQDGEISLSEVVDVNPKYPKPSGLAPYIDMAALSEKVAGIENVKERTAGGGARFMNGDALVARITPCLENGKAAFVDCLEYGVVGVGSTEFTVLKAKGPVTPVWTYFLARSERFRQYMIRNMTGTSGRQRCPSDAVSNYKINRPEVASLNSFAQVAEPFFDSVRKLRGESDEAASALHDLVLKMFGSSSEINSVRG
jgi:type I restriction enzyme S subunit